MEDKMQQTTELPQTSHTAPSDESSRLSQEKQSDSPVRLETPNPPGPASNSPSPPPNGGIQAWLHVLGGAMLFFNTWGILNTFGVFQTYYESGTLFKKSSSDIAWIGSIQAFLVQLMGIFVGPIYDRGYLRALLVVGSFGIVFGHMMLSICKEYWQVLLAQGFVVGMGAGCLFVPCVSILPSYFSTRLGLAMGLASSGSSLGGIIYPIVFHRLIDRIGFGWSVRVLGFMALGTLLIPTMFMKMRVKSAKPRAIIDKSAFTDFSFLSFAVATLIGNIGLMVILFYISYYAESQGLTDANLAFYLVAFFNVGSCFGRVVPNALSDKAGPLNIITPCAGITGLLIFCMMAVHSEAAVIVMSILTGFFSGVFIALPPVCFAMLTKNKAMIGTRIGMGYSVTAFGLLAGGPAGGAILGAVEPLNWSGLWIFGGVASCVAGLMCAIVRVKRSGFKLIVKA